MPVRRLALLLLIAAGLGGCSAAGEPGGESRYSNPGIPFTFAIPADFTKASIDQGNTRGRVVGAVGLTKVDVIAVRRETAYGRGAVAHEVLGQRVTSELHAVPGFAGWTLECQYGEAHASKLKAACRRAIATVRRG